MNTFESKVKILVDNGHGEETKGKRSPDGRLIEASCNRDIAKRIVNKLKAKNYDAVNIVPEERDIPISERVRRVNNICRQVGSSNCLLISVHVNAAAADGKWHDASGWTVWVSSTNASDKSKKLASLLYDEAKARGLKGNRYVPGCQFWTINIPIVRDTHCPAVLTENMFQDNLKDVEFLLSEKGREMIADLHVEGIIKYLKSL